MMNSIYAGYVHPSKENVRPDSPEPAKGTQKKVAKSKIAHDDVEGGSSESTDSGDGVKGFRFDLEPYYIKVPSLENEVRLLRREKDDLLQNKAELQKKMEDMEAKLESMSREKDMFELEKQIVVIILA